MRPPLPFKFTTLAASCQAAREYPPFHPHLDDLGQIIDANTSAAPQVQPNAWEWLQFAVACEHYLAGKEYLGSGAIVINEQPSAHPVRKHPLHIQPLSRPAK